AGRGHGALPLAGVLAGEAQLLRGLVVEANRGLLQQLIYHRRIREAGAADLVVVVAAGRLRPVRLRKAVENRRAEGPETARRDLAEHAAVGETGGLVG